MYAIITMMAAGITILKLTLNLSRILQPCVCVAIIVVSDINDRLSPKNAPPTTVATIIGRLAPVSAAIPAATGVRATVVPTDVPMASEMKHDARNSPGSSILSGIMRRVKFTVASIAPMLLAAPANAPARMKIHIISIIVWLPAPAENSFIRSSRVLCRVMAMANTADVRNATVIGIL